MTNSTPCSKCGGPTDTGHVSPDEGVPYVSDRQTGMFRRATRVRRAVACQTCGFIELYVDPAELRNNIGG